MLNGLKEINLTIELKNKAANTLYIALWERWFSDLSSHFQARKTRKRIL
jgi:hypothetical protein